MIQVRARGLVRQEATPAGSVRHPLLTLNGLIEGLEILRRHLWNDRQPVDAVRTSSRSIRPKRRCNRTSIQG